MTTSSTTRIGGATAASCPRLCALASAIAAAAAASCQEDGGASPRVVISEIMYHPVLEDGGQDEHEFVEIANAGRARVSLGGWRLAGDVTFVFPPDAAIGPGEHRVIARRRPKLAAVSGYGLRAESLWGDYRGGLENDKGDVALVDAAGRTIDRVRYRDDAPWPIAADALGAGEDWLPPELLPLERHRHRGRSLERIALDGPSEDPANWEASPLDGATPGRPNAAAGLARPVATAIEVASARGPAGPPRPGEPIVVAVKLGGAVAARQPQLELFVDELGRRDEPRARLPMAPAPDGRLVATIPPQPAHAIVRYRVLGDSGRGLEAIAPRASDPSPFHGLFVAPAPPSPSRAYHLFIDPADWTRLWDNVAGGYNTGCQLNPRWNDVVPAVFAHDGKVFDVRVRYQGSRTNRRNGQRIDAWPHPGPERPAPLVALSFKVKFPRYAPFEGMRAVNLNKLNQACPGVNTHVMASLMESVGIPAYRSRFARLHVNGGYYNYVMELEDMDERIERRHVKKGEPVGDLFKSDGYQADQADQGLGNGGVLKEFCGFTAERRYRATYRRQTNEGRDHADLIALIEDHAAARAAGVPALRTFLETRFDVERALDGYAVRVWAGGWDDAVHNYYLYRRPGDGKWLVIHNDFDLELGIYPSRAPSVSLYLGEDPNPDNVLPANLWKDSFLKAFRVEFDERLRRFGRTLLSDEAVERLIDEGAAGFNLADWNEAPAAKRCLAEQTIQRLKTWAKARNRVVDLRLRAAPPPDRSPHRTCAEILKADPRAASGTHKVQPRPDEPAFPVHCDMTREGGGWTLVGVERSGYGGAFRFLDQVVARPEELLADGLGGLIGARFNGLHGEVLIQWKQDFVRFRTAEPLFTKDVKTAIPIADVVTSVASLGSWIASAGGAVFCRASGFPDVRPGDTAWALKPRDDTFTECGCSGGSLAGRGAFYGGARPGVAVPPCLNAAGGFAGVVEDKGRKGDFTTTYDTTIWIR